MRYAYSERKNFPEWEYYEVDESMMAVRQVRLLGERKTPFGACRLEEFREAVACQKNDEYVDRFDGISDQPVSIDEDEGLVEISAQEFEDVWATARSYLESLPLGLTADQRWKDILGD